MRRGARRPGRQRRARSAAPAGSRAERAATAESPPQFTPYSPYANSEIATGSVLELVVLLNTNGIRNVFQTVRNVIVNVLAIAGSEIGRIMRPRIPSELQPSIASASTIDTGTSSKNVFNSHTANGNAIAELTRISPILVS